MLLRMCRYAKSDKVTINNTMASVKVISLCRKIQKEQVPVISLSYVFTSIGKLKVTKKLYHDRLSAFVLFNLSLQCGQFITNLIFILLYLIVTLLAIFIPFARYNYLKNQPIYKNLPEFNSVAHFIDFSLPKSSLKNVLKDFLVLFTYFICCTNMLFFNLSYA